MKKKSRLPVYTEPIGNKGGVGNTLFFSLLADGFQEMGISLNLIESDYQLGDLRRFHPSITRSKYDALGITSDRDLYDYLHDHAYSSGYDITIYDGCPPYKNEADDAYMMLEGMNQTSVANEVLRFVPVVILDHSMQSRSTAIPWIELLKRRNFSFILVHNYWAGAPSANMLDTLLTGHYKNNILAEITLPRIPQVVLQYMHELCMSCRDLAKHGVTIGSFSHSNIPDSIWSSAIDTWEAVWKEFERTQLLKRILDPIENKVEA